MATMYYTTAHQEIRPYMPPDPVLVCAASCLRVHKNGQTILLTPRLPAHVTDRAADCGGFNVVAKWAGRYPFTTRQYATWLMAWRPSWAAMMDWCCVDTTAGKRAYPGREVVAERQRQTTAMAYELAECYPRIPWTPVIQGFYPEEFQAHARQLLPLIERLFVRSLEPATYEDGDDLPVFRVCLGSICGATPATVREVLRQVQEIVGQWIPFHLLGWKLKGIQNGDELVGVISYDTAAFNDRLNEEGRERQRESGKTQAHYLWEDAQPRYKGKLERAQAAPVQIPLFTPAWPNIYIPRPYDKKDVES